MFPSVLLTWQGGRAEEADDELARTHARCPPLETAAMRAKQRLDVVQEIAMICGGCLAERQISAVKPKMLAKQCGGVSHLGSTVSSHYGSPGTAYLGTRSLAADPAFRGLQLGGTTNTPEPTSHCQLLPRVSMAECAGNFVGLQARQKGTHKRARAKHLVISITLFQQWRELLLCL
jgi:hypothetical protein